MDLATPVNLHVLLGMLPNLPKSVDIELWWARQYVNALVETEDLRTIRPLGVHGFSSEGLRSLMGGASSLGGLGYCAVFAVMAGAPRESLRDFLSAEVRDELIALRDINHEGRHRHSSDVYGATDDLWDLLRVNPFVSDAECAELSEDWGLSTPSVSRQSLISRNTRYLYPDWGSSAFLTKCCVNTSLVPRAPESDETSKQIKDFTVAVLRRGPIKSRKQLYLAEDWTNCGRGEGVGLAHGYWVARKMHDEFGADSGSWPLVLGILEGPLASRLETAHAVNY